jgi:hypothetical protein
MQWIFYIVYIMKEHGLRSIANCKEIFEEAEIQTWVSNGRQQYWIVPQGQRASGGQRVASQMERRPSRFKGGGRNGGRSRSIGRPVRRRGRHVEVK